MSDKRIAQIVLEYQNYIENPPVQPKQMYGTAASSDTITIESWRQIWIDNVKANKAKFGSFKEKSLGKLFGINQNKPAIVVGSGPSLGYNGEQLKNKRDILTVSCLHNYHYFEDRGIHIDYYVTLDAGKVVLEEIAEGGAKTEAEYWESTKNKKVCAFIGTSPEFFEKWQGEVYLFNAPIPDAKFLETMRGLEEFNLNVSNGGNVLGAALYIAKGIFGSNPVAYVGADFSFGYNSGDGHKFHSWNSKYDSKLGNVQRGNDVFGNKVLTWPSYWQFKNFFDYVALTVPGIYVNCTEGGMLGAYPEGNLMAIKQMSLKSFIYMYYFNESIKAQCESPELPSNLLLY